jgi:hypothetical protein
MKERGTKVERMRGIKLRKDRKKIRIDEEEKGRKKGRKVEREEGRIKDR